LIKVFATCIHNVTDLVLLCRILAKISPKSVLPSSSQKKTMDAFDRARELLAKKGDIRPPDVGTVPTEQDFVRIAHGLDAMMEKMVNMIWADAATRAYQTVRAAADMVKEQWDWGVPVYVKDNMRMHIPHFVIRPDNQSMSSVSKFRPLFFVFDNKDGERVMTTSEQVVRDYLAIDDPYREVYAYPLDNAQERVEMVHMYTSFLAQERFKQLVESRVQRGSMHLDAAILTSFQPFE